MVMGLETRGVGLSIVIPIYNEQESVGPLIERLAAIRALAQGPIEFILVDDGSTDETGSRLAGAETDDVTVIRLDKNRGYGYALKRGLRAAAYDFMGIADADGTYPVERLVEFHRLAVDEGFDMVVGARTGQRVRIPLIRRPAKAFFRWLASYLTDTDIPDINSGLRVMRTSLVEKFIKLLPDGFSFTTTITMAMLTSEHTVSFQSIDYESRVGSSKIRPIRDTINFLMLTVRTFLYFNPLRVFVPMAVALAILSVVVLCVSWYALGRAMDVTFGVILMSAVQVLAVGLLADVVDRRLP